MALEQLTYFTLLDRSSYVSDDIFAREAEQIFRRQWSFVAHTSAIPDAGDFVVEEVAGESLVINRGDDGEVNAFFNVCRHRGYQFCEQERGSAKRFICPYHQWSYGRDGRVLNVPGAPDGEFFDYADWGLHRAHVEVWHGLIFVALGRTAPAPLGPVLDDKAAGMVPARPERLKEAFRETYDVKTNWKVLLENYLECYHCRGSHPELCRTMSLEDTYGSTAGWIGEYFGGSMPMKPGVKTASMDGELVSTPLGDWAALEEIPDNLGGGFGIVPLLSRVICHADHMLVQLLRPRSVSETTWESRWFVRDDAVEGVDYDLERLTDVWRATNREDIGLCEGAFRGVRSSRFVSGPLHPEREAAIRSALETYRSMMDAPA
jgi:phenylpropionate dioxygenase-like ring-hydroxylating dioxygenase large terminal subunit